jgi:dsRNA-specific ribonuclease
MANRRMQVKPRAELEDALGYKFKNQSLIWQALTHKSAITEKHPMAFNCDLFPLAFVGDTVLKYAAARDLFLNGKKNVIRSCAELHKATQTIIPNATLAVIAREQLHLEEYLIRGNNHRIPSENMYADCMEAVFGAVALDCEGNQQQLVFDVIARICSRHIDNWLVPTYEDQMMPTTSKAQMFSATKEAVVSPATKEARVFLATKEARVFPDTKEARVFPATKEARVFPATKEARMFPATKEAQMFSATNKAKMFSATNEDNDEWIDEYNMNWPLVLLKPALLDSRETTPLDNRATTPLRKRKRTKLEPYLKKRCRNESD